jgi:hypothetical protein
MSRLTRILRSQPGEITFLEIFQDALEKINEIHGFEFNYSHFEKGNHEIGRHVYLETHERAVLDLVEDFHAIVRYVLVEGETQDLVDEICVWLDASLPIVSLRELQEEATKHMNDRPLSIIHLAIGAGELADANSLKIIKKGLSHKDELVRLCATEAAGLTQWSDLWEYIISLSKNDPSPKIKILASTIIASSQKDKL